LSLDLSYDDGQLAIQTAVDQFCAEVCPDDVVKATAGRFPAELWRELAALGVLGAARPDGDGEEGGGALEVAAAMESLGRAVFPGPLAETFLATLVLPPGEADAVAEGTRIATAGEAPWMPWSQTADVFLDVQGDEVFRAAPSGSTGDAAVGSDLGESLGGEQWGRVELERLEKLPNGERGLRVAAIARAAFLSSAARRLIDDAAEHARVRTQFGRPIGEFQAVAHPLADCVMAVDASAMLARAAAERHDAGDFPAATRFAFAARLSSDRAALETAHVTHQIFGALGITLEGPVFHISRRLRQLASTPGAKSAREGLLEEWGLPQDGPENARTQESA